MGRKKSNRDQIEETKQSRWGFRGMTVREWLELLIVPVVLALITVVFTWQQNERQQDLETKRTNHAQKIEDQRAEAERELAKRRAQDEALQAYLNQMSNLLLENDLRESKEDSEVRTLARARTLTVLGRLDPNRKTALTQFLVEAELVQRGDGKEPIISLRGADLFDATLFSANLSGANLSEATLSSASLLDADLSSANLRFAVLEDADLSTADLSGANLIFAFLREATLRYADLSDADLSGADLRGANLSDAQGITNEELEQQTHSLKGATMPSGQKYEDWIKSKNREEGGKNDGSS